MRYTLLILLLAVTTTSCRNVLKTNVEVLDSGLIYPMGNSHTLEDNDSAVIASLESDSCLYDPKLIIKPIDDSILQYFILNHDATDTIKANIPEYVVVKYKMKESYIIAYESDETGRVIIMFLFNDNDLSLENGIRIGDNLRKIKALYNRAILYGNVVSIIEESEMAEIKLFVKDEVIVKIIYMNYESCYELDLL